MSPLVNCDKKSTVSFSKIVQGVSRLPSTGSSTSSAAHEDLVCKDTVQLFAESKLRSTDQVGGKDDGYVVVRRNKRRNNYLLVNKFRVPRVNNIDKIKSMGIRMTRF